MPGRMLQLIFPLGEVLENQRGSSRDAESGSYGHLRRRFANVTKRNPPVVHAFRVESDRFSLAMLVYLRVSEIQGIHRFQMPCLCWAFPLTLALQRIPIMKYSFTL